MQRRFFSNLSLLFFLNGIIKPLWIFGIDRKVQLALGTHVYGTYYALLNLTMILNIVLDIGITNYTNREVARHPEIVPHYFGSLFIIKIFLLAIYAVAVFTAAFIIHIPVQAMGLLAGLIALQFLQSLLQFMRANVSGLHLFVSDSVLSILDKTLVILFCGSVLYIAALRPVFSIGFFVLVQTAAISVAVLCGYIIIRRHVRRIPLRIDKALTLSILRESRPYAIMVLLMAAYSRIDGVMLERLGGADLAGQYAKDFRLYDACCQFGVLFAGLLLPMFARMLREHKDVTALAGNAFAAIWLVAVVIIGCTTAYAAPIHALLYHDSANVLYIIMWAFMGTAAMYVFSTLLTANGSLKTMIRMAIAGLVLNVAINSFIQPGQGTIVAAAACTATQTLMASLAVYYCYRQNIIHLNITYWLKLAATAVITLGLAWYIGHHIKPLLVGIGCIGFIAVVSAFVLRMFTWAQLRELLRKPVF